jgi:hypothetical protein
LIGGCSGWQKKLYILKVIEKLEIFGDNSYKRRKERTRSKVEMILSKTFFTRDIKGKNFSVFPIKE